MKDIAQYAGVLALASFAGCLLGGIALSFFWKSFGPWKLLEEAKRECAGCRLDREADARSRTELEARLTDLVARHDILKDAVNRAGLGLNLGPVYENFKRMD
jgi:hypothetical protein